MAFKQLIKTLKDRRSQLVDFLNSSALDPAKQHQTYGAIKELDVVIQVIELHAQRHAQQEPFVLAVDSQVDESKRFDDFYKKLYGDK